MSAEAGYFSRMRVLRPGTGVFPGASHAQWLAGGKLPGQWAAREDHAHFQAIDLDGHRHPDRVRAQPASGEP
jgi:hypothetical protein